MNKWVTRALFILGGYVLRLWLDSKVSTEDNAGSPRHGRRRALRRRPPPPQEELKLVLVVNDSLKMGKGKIGKRKNVYRVIYIWCLSLLKRLFVCRGAMRSWRCRYS